MTSMALPYELGVNLLDRAMGLSCTRQWRNGKIKAMSAFIVSFDFLVFQTYVIIYEVSIHNHDLSILPDGGDD